jgi:hypothetical protein
MTPEEALNIRELKKTCTYRALAEIMYPESDRLHGNQTAGSELCKEALKVLYPDYDVWTMYMPEMRFGKQFVIDNCSKFGYNGKRLEQWIKDGADCKEFRDYDMYYWWE